jgi:acyl carrier protein phosphodiesterase
MNYLAHVYLSGDNDELAIGNFIADQVKGKSYISYPQGIRNGILLHRKIDQFTDQHLLFKKNVSLIFPHHRHYSRVIVDMFFDHFLAAHWNDHHSISLEKFSNDFYLLLQQHKGSLPLKTQKLLPVMSLHNWFLAYRSIEGLQRILFQMSQRTQFPSKMDEAIHDLKRHYNKIESDFHTFFEELKHYTQQERIGFNELRSPPYQ